MYLSDTKIRELIDRKVLLNADVSNIGQVTHDLRADGFFIDGNKRTEVKLNPGDSMFVSCVECVQLPRDLTASVLLRNSRIRQGLSLDAPLYFPGHVTRLFYCVTNVSGDVISLDRSKGIAQMAFQHVDGTVANPYDGAFSDELDFSGLAGYSDIYAGELKKVDNKREEVEHIESRIYSNILALFAIFAAIFTLVDVNANGVSDKISTVRFTALDLLIIGGFLILASAIGALLARDGSKKTWLPLILGIVCIAAAVVLACFEAVGIPVLPQCL
ncbi:MAG: hypothetical protein ACLROE_06770 [Collinsella intestinalis]